MGQSNSSSLQVTLNNTTAGVLSGTVTVQFVSDGTGIDNGAPIDNGSQQVPVNGKVYTPAVADLQTTSANFGIVPVGDGSGSMSQGIAVANGAQAAALNDVPARV